MPAKKGAQGAGSTPAEDHNTGKTPLAGERPPSASSAPPTNEPASDDSTTAPGAVPEPIDLDKPPPGLPEMALPSSPLRDAREAASERRARRLRVEFIGGGILLLIGIGASAATQTVAILVLAILVLGCLVAYELLVSNLE